MKARLIYNPTAGQQFWKILRSAFRPEEAKSLLEARGWQVEICRTDALGDSARFVREAVEQGLDAVIVAGGDGTINQVLPSLIHSSVALGVIPIGTTNVLARELKVPFNWRRAIAHLPDSTAKQIDIGQVDGRHFLIMSGVGFDAHVNLKVSHSAKKWLGPWVYWPYVTREFFRRYPAQRATITMTKADGEIVTLRRVFHQIAICNLPTYGNGFRIVNDALLDDGLLHVLIFKARRSFGEAFWYLLTGLLGKHLEWTDVERYRVTHLEVKTAKPMPFHVDAEPQGETDLTAHVHPRSLKVLAPKI